MADPVSAIVGIGGNLVAGEMAGNAAEDAANIQAGASQQGIAEQRRQFDFIRELLKPYVEAGAPALQQQQALLGLGGTEAQQRAISALEESPLYQAQVRQGEEAMLQRASATGGLRGGNIQGALAQFRPAMLQEEINRQYGRLGGLTSLGQQSAVGVGTMGQAMGTQVSNLLAQQGAALAGGALAQPNPFATIGKGLGAYYGMTGKSPFESFSKPAPSTFDWTAPEAGGWGGL